MFIEGLWQDNRREVTTLRSPDLFEAVNAALQHSSNARRDTCKALCASKMHARDGKRAFCLFQERPVTPAAQSDVPSLDNPRFCSTFHTGSCVCSLHIELSALPHNNAPGKCSFRDALGSDDFEVRPACPRAKHHRFGRSGSPVLISRQHQGSMLRCCGASLQYNKQSIILGQRIVRGKRWLRQLTYMALLAH